MANKRSAAKRTRQNVVRHERNQARRTEIKTLAKKCREAIEAGDWEGARALARQTESRLGKAAKKGVIHGNTANRRAARLHRAVSRAADAAKE